MKFQRVLKMLKAGLAWFGMIWHVWTESGKPDPEIATNTFFSTQTRSEFGMTCGSAPVRKTAAHRCIAESCLSRLRDVKGGVKGCQIWGLPTALLHSPFASAFLRSCVCFTNSWQRGDTDRASNTRFFCMSTQKPTNSTGPSHRKKSFAYPYDPCAPWPWPSCVCHTSRPQIMGEFHVRSPCSWEQSQHFWCWGRVLIDSCRH